MLIKLKQTARPMSKQKLAQMVLEKMKHKKEEEERNRPHHEVLQLLVTFEVEGYRDRQMTITQLQEQIQKEKQFMELLETHLQELDNTGKRNYPRFIVRPDFIATQHVKPLFKEFYQKVSNTFLREDLLKVKRYELDCSTIAEIKSTYAVIREKQAEKQQLESSRRNKVNQQRVRNLKEQLRLRSLKQQQSDLESTIAQEKEDNRALLAEYELKKVNLQSRTDFCANLQQLITKQKQLIQSVYNPKTYREYLKNIFNIRNKNEWINKNLVEVVRKLSEAQQRKEGNQQFLELTDGLFVHGRTFDSPSRSKRKSVSNVSVRRSNRDYPSPKNSSLFTQKYQASLSKSQFDKTHSKSVGLTTASLTSNFTKEIKNNKRSYSTSSSLKAYKKKQTHILSRSAATRQL